MLITDDVKKHLLALKRAMSAAGADFGEFSITRSSVEAEISVDYGAAGRESERWELHTAHAKAEGTDD